MLSIRIGFTPQIVLGYLRDASNGARLVLNSENNSDKIAQYLEWAANQQRTLGSAIAIADMDRLVTTRTYWALLSSAGVTSIALLNIELQNRVMALDNEEIDLRDEHSRWFGAGSTTAAVLDTNALITHHASLQTVEWHRLLGEPETRTVRLLIPLIVIDELDKLKRSTGNMRIGGKDRPRRTLARQALRTVAGMFPTVNTVVKMDQSGETPFSRQLSIELYADAPGHVRLDTADAEIRDRALALTAHTNRVLLVTYDLGNQFAAGISGLESIRLIDEEDTVLEADPVIALPRRK